MSFKIECPSCSQHLEVEDEHVGMKVQCPTCLGEFAVQRPGWQSPPVPPVVISAGGRNETPCPFCGETVLAVARKCKHCGEFLDGSEHASAPSSRDRVAERRPQQASEETVYSDTRVTVTTTRVIVGHTTYALRNITSVKVAYTPARRGAAILLLGAGILCTAGAILTYADDPDAASGGVLFGMGLAVPGLVLVLTRKPDYHVAFASSSGETHALTSKDRAYILRVVESINEAIVRYR